jgi:hypothetical protein
MRDALRLMLDAVGDDHAFNDVTRSRQVAF